MFKAKLIKIITTEQSNKRVSAVLTTLSSILQFPGDLKTITPWRKCCCCLSQIPNLFLFPHEYQYFPEYHINEIISLNSVLVLGIWGPLKRANFLFCIVSETGGKAFVSPQHLLFQPQNTDSQLREAQQTQTIPNNAGAKAGWCQPKLCL